MTTTMILIIAAVWLAYVGLARAIAVPLFEGFLR